MPLPPSIHLIFTARRFIFDNPYTTQPHTQQISAVPAVIGSWCWPILVGSMLSVAASNVPTTLVDFFHGIQVAITLALMTNIVQFGWWTCKKRRKNAKSHWDCYWSVYVLLLSTCLVLVQPTSMLVISSFKLDNWFFDGDSNPNALVPNTTTGWMIQIFCTYLGYLLMFIGVFGTSKLHLKLRKKWREIRHGSV